MLVAPVQDGATVKPAAASWCRPANRLAVSQLLKGPEQGMAGLSRSLEFARDRYDVIVIGSGYGGGVAASRLARAGKKIAVLERGREVLTGHFPTRFPDLKNEMQVTGKRLRTGPLGALRRPARRGHARPCRLRSWRRLAHQCRRRLAPDARVFADARWPGQVAQDGLLEEGFRRARRWLQPQSDPRAPSTRNTKRWKPPGRRSGMTSSRRP